MCVQVFMHDERTQPAMSANTIDRPFGFHLYNSNACEHQILAIGV